MELRALQQSMAQLVRTGVPMEHPTADAAGANYLRTVAGATGLRVMREVAREWRQLLLRQGCPLTTGALAGEGTLGHGVEQFMARERLDPMAQGLAARFLAWVADSRSDDIASLARFERALINARRGLPVAPVTVTWTCDPMAAIAAALHASPMPLAAAAPIYVTDIASHLPGEFAIASLSGVVSAAQTGSTAA